ncbi:MAG: T9SS type A sorting domain-containing protein [Candidatus Cloacimonetes bacterium]|nr:T9SS type A sorting domain-containing protein [Candidatus Cloacimonadota bacterium]
MKRVLFLIFCISTISLSGLRFRVPYYIQSTAVADLNLDGYPDVVAGSKQVSVDDWAGIAVLLNDMSGNVSLQDSCYMIGNHDNIAIGDMDRNQYPDIVTTSCVLDADDHLESIHFAIVHDYAISGFSYIDSIAYDKDKYMSGVQTGNFDGVPGDDIAFCSNHGRCAGFVMNDYGFFSQPEYIDLGLAPQGISVGDIDGDSRDEVLIAGQWLTIFDYEDGLWTSRIIEPQIPMFMTHLKDMDNDDDLDIAAGFWSIGDIIYVTVYCNDGSGNFTLDYTYYYYDTASSSGVEDFDGNGYNDMLFGNMMMFNLGNLEFTETDTTFLQGSPFNFADMDGNGAIDIIGPSHGGGVSYVGIAYNDGTGHFVADSLPPEPEQTFRAKLRNYPNPFKVNTVFEFELPESGEVVIDVFNCRGQKVRRMELGYRVEGKQSAGWDGTDNRGRTLPSGVYLCQLIVQNKALATSKLVLVK